MSDTVHTTRSGPAPLTYEIFISYSREDDKPPHAGDSNGWVTALRDEILVDHRRFSTEPLRIFFDTDEIRGMDDWRHRILDGLRHSRILLVCLSPNYFDSEYCRWEWEEYARRQVHALMGNESITSVYFVEVPGSDEQANTQELRKWVAEVMRPNFTDLRPWFPHGTETLRDQAVRKHIEALGTSLWDRIQRARRATGIPGNIRRVNPYFVGRRTELRQLHENLACGAVGVVTAVHGLGGQGKTELAIAYAHGWADFYPGGLWVLNAEGIKEMLPLIGELTQSPELDIPPSAGSYETAEQRGRRVLFELKRRALVVREHDPDRGASCLLLLDNVSEPDLLSEPQLAGLPREPWLQVVATTRLGEDVLPASQQKSLAFVAVDALNEEDALALLRDHQKHQKWASKEDEDAARKIVRELGGFTLAIESVALHLGLHPDIRPAAYLARLKKKGLPSADEIVKNPKVAAQIEHREKQLALVLEATLDQLTPADATDLERATRTVLDYASLLPPDSIPWPWLRALVEQEHPEAFLFEEGDLDPWLALRRRLEGLRVLTPGNHPEIARIHRLVGAHLRDRMGKEAETAYLLRLQEVVLESATTLSTCWKRNPAHLWELGPIQETTRSWMDVEADVVSARIAGLAGDIEQTVGRLDKAEPFLLGAHGVFERFFSNAPDSEEAARYFSTSLEVLGCFYDARGQAGDAEEALDCFEKCLEIRRHLLEADPNSAVYAYLLVTSLFRLGDSYSARGQAGDADEALNCFMECREISQLIREANPNSSEAAVAVTAVLDSLGSFYLNRGQPGDADEALKCIEKSVEITQQEFEHNPNSNDAARNVSISLRNLGAFYLAHSQSGDAEKALKCFEESLEISLQMFEQNPNSTLAARDVYILLRYLGDFYLARSQSGDVEEALRYFMKCLDKTQQLHEVNPDSLETTRDLSIIMERLGGVYMTRGQSGEALECFEKCFEISQQICEANPNAFMAALNVGASLARVGDCYVVRGQAGDADEALKCFEKDLEISQQIFEVNSNSTQVSSHVSLSLQHLGDFYFDRGQAGDAEKALKYFEKSLEISQQIFDANPNSAAAAKNLLVCYRRTIGALNKNGRHKEGWAMALKSSDLREKFQLDEETDRKAGRIVIASCAIFLVLGGLLVWGAIKVLHRLFW